MKASRSVFAASVVVGLVLTAGVCEGASGGKLAGSLAGSVRDVTGIPQMGAVVMLYNRYDRLISKTLTDAKGDFGFEALLPDLYSVRVTLSSFVPALKRNIQIQPGVRSILAINLATVLSSIELVYNAPSTGTLMSDDWKWVLRSSMSTRPVLRALDLSTPDEPRQSASIFSDTRGMVRVSSGEDNPFGSYGPQTDLGTSFALATSIYGQSQLEFSGNIGYLGDSATPAAAFRTSFSRGESAPEVKLTMQQVALPSRAGLVMGSQNAPMLRTMSITTVERMQVNDDLHVDYGASLDSVQFLDRLNYISPFARASYDMGAFGTIDFGYSSGSPPVELLNNSQDMDAGLQAEMAALSMFPRVTVRDGHAHVQRTQNYELGYKLAVGSTTYSLGVYRETIGNAALTVSAPSGFYGSEDLLPDLASNSYVFNIGRYRRLGYTASITQAVGETYLVTVAYGRGGVLGTDGAPLQTDDPDELRNALRRSQRHWLRGRVAGTAPWVGTKFAASYEWTDYRSLMPGHVYLTQKMFPETGLNVRLRQPIPSFGGLPGRLEASAEMRNMLAQGYLNMPTRSGSRLVLTHSPRAVRGGLSFIF